MTFPARRLSIPQNAWRAPVRGGSLPRMTLAPAPPAARAILVPVSRAVGATWSELRDAVRGRWLLTRSCAKWMASQFYARDVGAPDSELLSRLESELAEEAAHLYPDLSAGELLHLCREVRRRYRSAGASLIWTRRGALAAYRDPVVCSIGSRAWRLQHGRAGWSITLALGRRDWLLRLDAVRARRFHAALRQFATGEVRRGSLAIFESGTVEALSGARRRRTTVVVRIEQCRLHGGLEPGGPPIQVIGRRAFRAQPSDFKSA